MNTGQTYYSKQAEVISALLWGPKRTDELVAMTGIHPVTLYRFLSQLRQSGVLRTDLVSSEDISSAQSPRLHTLIRHDGSSLP